MTVEYGSADGVATIRFARPDKLNALTPDAYVLLDEHLARAVADHTVQVIVLAGAGRAFVAGADIDHYVNLTQDRFEAFINTGHAVLGAIASSPKPVVAAVGGYAVGGGFEIALACDLIVATTDARFGLPEARLGLLPGGGGTQRLTRLVGRMRANDLIMSGRLLGAEEAQSWGIVSRLCQRGELDDAVAALVAELLMSAPASLGIAKRLVAEAGELPLEEGLLRERDLTAPLIETPDGREGVTAFVEKRRPRFTR